MTISKITGADMLTAIKIATSGLPLGSSFTISLFDSYDLFKLNVEQLVDGFDFDQSVAERIVDGLNQRDLSELSTAIGVKLVVDNKPRSSLIANAGIIRSAGVWSHNPAIPTDPDQIVEAIRRMATQMQLPDAVSARHQHLLAALEVGRRHSHSVSNGSVQRATLCLAVFRC